MPRIDYKCFLESCVKKPHAIFLIIGLSFGMIFLITVPAFAGGDEAAHFNRIFQICQGHLFGEKIPDGKGTYLSEAMYMYEVGTSPSVFIKSIFTGSTINSTPLTTPMHFENTELYTPITYIPQIASMLIARLLDLSVPMTYYLARLSGFIAWLAICAYGIKKMRVFGWAAVVLLLTPLSLQTATLVSADTMTVAISTLFVGLLADGLMAKEPMSRKQLAALSAVLLLLAFSKMPYMFLAPLILLLPAKSYPGGAKIKRYFLVTSAIVLSAVTVGWAVISQEDMVPYKYITESVFLDQKTQIWYFVEHPVSFAYQLYNVYIRSCYDTADPILGYAKQTSLDFDIPGWAAALYIALLTAVFMTLRSGAKAKDYLDRFSQTLCFGAAALVFILVNALLVITWTPIGSPIIEGMRPRYLIPIALMLILALLPLRAKSIKLTKNFYLLVPVCLTLIQLSVVISIYYRYYST